MINLMLMSMRSQNKTKKAVLITGTPGTGKTTLAERLSKRYGLRVIDAKAYAEKNNLIIKYDKRDKTSVVNEKKWAEFIAKDLLSDERNDPIIIEGLFSHFLSPKYTLLCIVTNSPLDTLKKRLTKRDYPKSKIADNLESEAFNECFLEAQELNHNIFSLNPSNLDELKRLYSILDEILLN